MKQNGKSTNSYFIFILLLGLLIVGLNFFGARGEDYTKAAFMADLQAENVTRVYISPNGEGQTGYLQAQLKNGASKTLYATNIEELEDEVDELRDYIEEIDEDLGEVEEILFEDDREKIELPGLKEENVYTKSSTPSFTMMGISDAGYPGGMSFIYKLSDGTFFIIDGGMCANRTGSNECSGDPSVNRLFKTLQALADDPNSIVISGWLITHIHNDHAGAFIDLAEKPEYLSKITIKKVIYSQPADSDMADGNQPKRLNWMPDALSKMNISKTVKAHPGQVFYFADLKLTILGSHDLIKPTQISRHNNASIVSMVETLWAIRIVV